MRGRERVPHRASGEPQGLKLQRERQASLFTWSSEPVLERGGIARLVVLKMTSSERVVHEGKRPENRTFTYQGAPDRAERWTAVQDDAAAVVNGWYQLGAHSG